jgi:hypothetical protein
MVVVDCLLCVVCTDAYSDIIKYGSVPVVDFLLCIACGDVYYNMYESVLVVARSSGVGSRQQLCTGL